MLLWDQVVEILREAILAYAQACHGNLGVGILAVTFLARLALLPLGIRAASAVAQHQRRMAGLQPALDALRKAYRNKPQRLSEETRRLFAREGISPICASGCLGSLAQLPVFVALYASVRQAASAGGRFLWIGTLARPDWPLTIVATVFTVLAATTGGGAQNPNRSLLLGVTAVVTAVALSKMAAGIGLYWAGSSVFGALQGWAVSRRIARHAA